MGARPTPPPGTTTGNFVSEWFGHRVWPTVDSTSTAESNQRARQCPFLTSATGDVVPCVKMPRGGTEPTGVCTISSDSNGPRQDWLACPNRILDQRFTVLEQPIRLLFAIDDAFEILVLPVTALNHERSRLAVAEAIEQHRKRVFLFTGTKFGGEVDIPETVSSPGSKIDISILEVTSLNPLDGKPDGFGKHVLYEIQTADFHGSPAHAVAALAELCPAGGQEPYHKTLASQVEVCGTGVEGPNKANIFKRTIYQMISKMSLVKHPDCAGFVIALPVPVWDSWLKHLGSPKLDDSEVTALVGPTETLEGCTANSLAWIFVFDIEHESAASPQPLRVVKRVAISTESLIHYMFDVAGGQAIELGAIARYRKTLVSRVTSNWQAGSR